MKAIVVDHYGPPEQLRLAELEMPVPGREQVLVRVHASSVNAADWHVMRGDPYIVRVMNPAIFGRSAPKHPILGRDVAGTVEAIGPGVTKLRPGDRVFGETGDTGGAFAEFVAVDEALLAIIPDNLSFEQAAAVPLAGTTALMGIKETGQAAPGTAVLVNGASGGVGGYAVQIAAALGADVTAVCSARNAALATDNGARRVIDYQTTDFTDNADTYDLILDLVGNRPLASLRRVLAPAGTLVLSGGGASAGGSLFGPLSLMIRGTLLNRFVRQRITMLPVQPDRDRLEAVRDLLVTGSVRPMIERSYPLSETPAAIRHLEKEHAQAKLVIIVS